MVRLIWLKKCRCKVTVLLTYYQVLSFEGGMRLRNIRAEALLDRIPLSHYPALKGGVTNCPDLQVGVEMISIRERALAFLIPNALRF